MQTGQTRMSNRCLSTTRTPKKFDEPLLEFRGQMRCYRQVPVTGSGEASAFYRVLLGHDEREPVAERDIGRREPMVIGIGVRDNLKTQGGKGGEEALWMPDPRNRMHHASLPRRGRERVVVRERTGRQRPALHGIESPRDPKRGEISNHIRPPLLAVLHHQIHRREAPERLSQRARGQEPAVAEPPHCVDDGDLEIGWSARCCRPSSLTMTSQRSKRI